MSSPVRILTTALTRQGPQVINPGVQAERLKNASVPVPDSRKVDIVVDVNAVKATGYPK